MNKAEADKILKWSQDKYLLMKQRQRGLEVPFEYYDGYADALSHLDEYVEETTTDTDPRLKVVERIRKVLDNDKDKRGYGHTFTELRNIEAEIKQEAEDESV
jgi:uncharacterized lipoprotein YehR (DUF1307 family)